jgi:hypothetical protein
MLRLSPWSPGPTNCSSQGQLHLHNAPVSQYRRHPDGTNRFFRVTVEEVSYDEMSKDMGL